MTNKINYCDVIEDFVRQNAQKAYFGNFNKYKIGRTSHYRELFSLMKL